MSFSTRPIRLAKLGVTLAVALVFFSTNVLTAHAFTLSPQSVVLQSGGTETMRILANQTNTNGVRVMISVTGMKISSFTPGDGLLSIGICSTGTAFTETEICVDLAGRDNFTSGQVVGTFTVVKSGDADGQIQIENGSRYANGTNVNSSTMVVSNSAQPIPGTNIQLTQTTLADIAPLLIIGAIIILAIIVLLVTVLRSKGGKSSTLESKSTFVANNNVTTQTTTETLPPL